MQDQLSLFSPDKTTAEEKQSAFNWGHESELTAVDELLAVAGRCRTSRELAELLGCLIRFPQYSIFNALLLFLQNPRASWVATAGNWSRRHSRTPRPGARPLIILAPMAPVLFLYDVSDTQGPPLGSAKPPTLPQNSAPIREIFDKTKANCEVHGICMRRTAADHTGSDAVVRLTAATRKQYQGLDLSPNASYLIIVDERAALANQYRDLVHGLGQIFCGHFGIDAGAWWPERVALSTQTGEIEANAVTFLVCGRLKWPFDQMDAADPYHDLPPISLNAVIQAAGYIEEMGKQIWSRPKKKSRYKTS